ncbi:alpha/beta fold hydrolase [Actinomadura barringtoniae]|uniref:Alpha/beta fold hydrolase n=1 Tax=Actinomadura barringtoniae TaxID=1427535 RepID=A0A939PSM6_9ACTN|nr:alpha/beta fold hydrolase [Actinomadura barringtoniae]MBO2455504.1 alpha/beta fold hydrolase [Actinomadura barringtoniae]
MSKIVVMGLAGSSVVAPVAASADPAPECLPVPHAECGTVQVPLVRDRPGMGNTTVAYAVIRHRGKGAARGMLAVNPGGPGDSTIAFGPTYAKVFAGLLQDHDLLLVDPRGVNRSTPVDCGLGPDLPSTRDGFVRAVGDCGTKLGERARAYTSAETADDIDAVRAKLGVPRLDLLGESYGTYLMAVYAQRHPHNIRSVVLSSAYPLAFDMWARPNARAARRTLTLMCERSAGACDGRKVLNDIGKLSKRLRAHPISYDGRKLDDTSLASIVYDSASQAPKSIGDVPFIVGKALHGDNEPLLKAAREQGPVSGSSADEQPFNAAVAASVMCNDYPTLWDRKAPVGTRLRQYATARGKLAERALWPFGKTAWTSAIDDRGDSCIRWPAQGAGQATGHFPDVPVLVVSGELDTNTPTEEGRLAARQFRRSTVVEVPNVGHVAEREPSGCAAAIETGFIQNGRVGDTTCLAKIPPTPVRTS